MSVTKGGANNGSGSNRRRVCVIGAGTAGLCAIRHALQHDMDVTCYEHSKEIGGTWVYSEDVSTSKYEDEIHSSMYEGLCTNLPKEVMNYPDFPYPKEIEASFVTSQQVLDYLRSYAKHFELTKHIKFRHSVIRVRPWRGVWELYVWDMEKDNYDVVLFDYIFVCNGHYTKPIYPEIEDMSVFQGKQMHSHLYRRADAYKDQRVLIVGAGPSGMDIANNLRKQAKHVYLSHHLEREPNTVFMKNVTQKPDVRRFTEWGAIFEDDTSEMFDTVIFCTGYKYCFPFLSHDCGVHVVENSVRPLWKHIINIKFPTMALIGLPFLVVPSQCFDLQVRFAMKYFIGEKLFPSHDEMKAEMEQEMAERLEEGLSVRQTHQMGERQGVYYSDLCALAEIENIKPVIGYIMKDCSRKYIFELEHYRSTCYRIIDDEHYVKFPLKK